MLLAGDVELLLSYLTVPYLCQPLLLRFFCRHDRVLALRDPALREMLQAALFEPGRIVLSRNASECPQQVPATGRAEMALVGSPNGQLLLELTHSPQPLLEALAECVKLALDVATSSTSMTVDIVLFISRLYARVMSAVTFVHQVMSGEHRSQQRNWEFSLPKAGTSKHQNVVGTLQQAMKDQRDCALGAQGQGLLTCLDSWLKELWHNIEKKPDLMDENVQRMCDIHAHILLLLRSMPLVGRAHANQKRSPCHHVQMLLGSYSFLMAHHSWNTGLLQIPEPEVMEVLQVQRRFLLEWLDSCDASSEFDEALNTVLQPYVIDDHGHDLQGKMAWGKINDDVLQSMGCYALHERTGSGCISLLPRKGTYWLEVNLQLLQISMRDTSMQALDGDVMKSSALQKVLHRKNQKVQNLQGIRVLESQTAVVVELMSHDLLVSTWAPIGSHQPEFLPSCMGYGDLYDAKGLQEGLDWVGELFEPIRLQFFDTDTPPQFFLKSDAAASASVAILAGIHPKLPGKIWKEAHICRSLQMVQIFGIRSYGHQFYRVLEYCSDCRFSLRHMQPSSDDRESVWPALERFAAGEPSDLDSDAVHSSSTTVYRRQIKVGTDNDEEERATGRHWPPQRSEDQLNNEVIESSDSELDISDIRLETCKVQFLEPFSVAQGVQEVNFSLVTELQPDTLDTECKYNMEFGKQPQAQRSEFNEARR